MDPASRIESPSKAPVLFLAPQGLTVTGVNTWIARSASALARRGRPAAVLVHGGIDAHAEVDLSFDPAVRVLRPDLGGASLSAQTSAYSRAVHDLFNEFGQPVVLVPSRHHDCFGAAVGVAQEYTGRARVLLVQHIDAAYERAVIDHYAEAAPRLVGISRRIAESLAERHPGRRLDIARIDNAVPVEATLAARAPISGRPLRLVYTGRLDHEQKRVRVLVHLSDELETLGIDHTMTLIGDGPAADEIRAAAFDRPSLRVVGAVPPNEITAALDEADIFVMASRHEGLSISLLEALARGCCPIVTAVSSGANDAIDHERSGYLVPFEDEEDDRAVAAKLAEVIEDAMRTGVHALGAVSHALAIKRFNLDRQIDALDGVIEEAAFATDGTFSAWPLNRPLAFPAVPNHAAERLEQVLRALNAVNRRVLIHGVGAHTRALAPMIKAHGSRVVGFCDDDPERHGGEFLGRPIVSPEAARDLGATDVVISSHLHEDAIWRRRAVYETQGVQVHRIYGTLGDRGPFDRPAA